MDSRIFKMVIGVIKRKGVEKDVAGEKRQEFCEVKKKSYCRR